MEIRNIIKAGAAALGAAVVLNPFIRNWYNDWGATDSEKTENLPGDEIINHPDLQTTRATSIEAAPEIIWPLLTGLYTSRRGFYRYKFFDHLSIASEEENRSLVLQLFIDSETREPFNPAAPKPEQYLAITWCYYLDPIDEDQTRLIVRSRRSYKPNNLCNHMLWTVIVEPVHFLLERNMLLDVQQKAEQIQNEDS